MKNIAIIYHDADFDGKLSNEVCRYWLAKQHPEATVLSFGWDYGRPWPDPTHRMCDAELIPYAPQDWTAYDAIYIVDLSVDELMPLHSLREKIVWIDHHKSAIDKWDHPDMNQLTGLVEFHQFNGIRIDGVAACRLCWQWFVRGEEGYADNQLSKSLFTDRLVDEPRLIRLAGEYDVWDKRDPDAEPLQYGLRSLDGERFASLIEEQFAWNSGVNAGLLFKTISNGRMLMSYSQKQADEHARKHACDVRFHGLTFCCLNIGAPGNSTLLRAAVKPHHDALMAWSYRGDHVSVSLYHAPGREHHDLSAIAKFWDGGGHKGACGFRVALSSMDAIIRG